MCNKKCCLFTKMTDKKALVLITKIGEPFAELPHLPQSLIDFFVDIAPWGVGLGGFFSITSAITSIKFGLGMNPISKFVNFYTGVSPLYFFLTGALQLLIALIAFKAFTPLKDKKLVGWIYIFWSNIVALFSSLLGFIFINGSGVGLLIAIAISWYFLFEIKPAYAAQKKSPVKKKKKTK